MYIYGSNLKYKRYGIIANVGQATILVILELFLNSCMIIAKKGKDN